jgi:hypothetical protein
MEQETICPKCYSNFKSSSTDIIITCPFNHTLKTPWVKKSETKKLTILNLQLLDELYLYGYDYFDDNQGCLHIPYTQGASKTRLLEDFPELNPDDIIETDIDIELWYA